MRLQWLLLALVVTSCELTHLEQPDLRPTDFVWTMAGCEDLTLYLGGHAEESALSFTVEDLVRQAALAHQTTTTTFELPDPRAELAQWRGQILFNTICGENPRRIRPYRKYLATAGTVTVTIKLEDDVSTPHVDIQMRDVVFDIDGTPQRLPWFEAHGIPVGKSSE
ncbi:hypothetical protein [Archangium lipolyticum]|uniref:hypothetical protein n=1 Tax=Archangium lipolyticum TaxID=2970465 RepID=UPI002149BDF4|nr:hypothetical protein [Archangium lipolyticum]